MPFWTESRAASRDSRNWSQLRVAQTLKPVNRTIVIPEITIPGLPAFDVPTIVAEYQVIASAPFSILNWNEVVSDPDFVLCLRFVSGYTVYRYRFWKFDTNDILKSPIVDLYTGQLKGQSPIVTFEVWTAGDCDIVYPSLTLTTSLIDHPTTTSPTATSYTPTINTALWYSSPISDPSGAGSSL